MQNKEYGGHWLIITHDHSDYMNQEQVMLIELNDLFQLHTAHMDVISIVQRAIWKTQNCIKDYHKVAKV